MHAAALATYKTTGKLPDDLVAAVAANEANGGAEKGKKGKKGPKLNKDGTEKAPRKPTAYNVWMQGKVRPSCKALWR